MRAVDRCRTCGRRRFNLDRHEPSGWLLQQVSSLTGDEGAGLLLEDLACWERSVDVVELDGAVAVIPGHRDDPLPLILVPYDPSRLPELRQAVCSYLRSGLAGSDERRQ